jgi:hypothetical protein
MLLKRLEAKKQRAEKVIQYLKLNKTKIGEREAQKGEHNANNQRIA